MLKIIWFTRKVRHILLGVILTCVMGSVFAQSSQKASVAQIDSDVQTMTLQDLALMTEKVLKTDVLVNAKDAETLVRIRTIISDFNYAKLLTQLKQNGFTAYKSNGDIHFIQTREARHSAIPVVQDNKTYFDDEYVTEYVKLEKSCSAQLLPVLRPLVPQDSHLALMDNPQTLLFSDTYLNIQRIKAVIKKIEDEMEKPADCTPAKQK